MATRSTAQNTRERILAFLRENRTATVPALSRAWGLTRADIRHHIQALAQEGLIEPVPRELSIPAQRGRPILTYRLTERAVPGNYQRIASAFLAAINEVVPEDQQASVLELVAGQLAHFFSPPANATQRYNQAVQFLNTMEYRARWEAGVTGPRFLLRSCPYAAILPLHPQLCQIDIRLLERLFQLPLQQLARMDPQTGSPPACVFLARYPP